jgi:hypothetical protein
VRVAFVPRSTEIQPLFWRFVLITQTSSSSILPINFQVEGLAPCLTFFSSLRYPSDTAAARTVPPWLPACPPRPHNKDGEGKAWMDRGGGGRDAAALLLGFFI